MLLRLLVPVLVALLAVPLPVAAGQNPPAPAAGPITRVAATNFVRSLVPALMPSSAAEQAAQAPAAGRITLTIVGGNDAINNIKQRTARQTIVQVEDENHRPVAGAAVAFLLPDTGPSGVFANGAKTASVITGPDGRAVMPRMTTNQATGQFQIHVNASYRGQQASISINQQNVAAAAPKHLGLSGKALAIIAGVAAAGAVTGAVVATRGGTPSGTLSPGSATISAPR